MHGSKISLCHKEPARSKQKARSSCDELILYGIRDTIATPRNSPRHRDGPHTGVNREDNTNVKMLFKIG